jgi:hypothetical protein
MLVRSNVKVLVACTILLLGGTAGAANELRADGGDKFVCLHHNQRPWECEPTWMHTCWCNPVQSRPRRWRWQLHAAPPAAAVRQGPTICRDISSSC